MAVVLLFRAAILLTPTITRMVQSGQPPPGQEALTIGKALWDRLHDPDEDPEDLTVAVAAAGDTVASVADFETTFELRKAQVRWGRTSGAAAGTDDAVTTHHFLKVVSGSPSATWVTGDFTAIESALLTFWNAIKANYGAETSYKQVRWYKAGPGITPPQVPVRIIDPASPGTGSSGTQLPPQCAISVTEKTTDPKSWGRFYLPAPRTFVTSSNGRIDTTSAGTLATAADTMYEAFITAGTPAVVYSSAKASRETRAGATLPARDARALGVKSLQIDDVWDVIRSRRWNEPLLRTQRDIAGS